MRLEPLVTKRVLKCGIAPRGDYSPSKKGPKNFEKKIFEKITKNVRFSKPLLGD